VKNVYFQKNLDMMKVGMDELIQELNALKNQ
jgi:hypothetical protein